MVALWNRLPTWTDWIVAAVGALIVFNLNVTAAGDPLSSIGSQGELDISGITGGPRTVFDGSLALGAVMLTAAGLVLAGIRPGQGASGLVVRTYGGVALAGFLGLLLDHPDGPVRTVQLVVYLMLILGAWRLARLAALVSDGQLDDVR